MTKIHNGVQIGSGFAYKGTDWNFSRDYYDTYAELLEDTEKYDFPTNFLTIVNDWPDTNAFTWAKSDSDTDYYTAPFLVQRTGLSAPNAQWTVVGDFGALSTLGLFTQGANIALTINLDTMFRGHFISQVGGISAADSSNISNTKVWDTSGGVVDLTTYAKKTDIPSLTGYVTSSSLNSTLTAYAKLADANFTALKVGGKTVATTESVNTAINNALSSALQFKGGISKSSEIPAAEAPKTGDVYVVLAPFTAELLVYDTTSGGTAKTIALETGDTLICVESSATVPGTSVSKSMWTVVQANLTNTVSFSSSLTANRLVIADSTSTVKSLAAGTNGQVLKVVNNVPTWSTEYSYSLPTASSSTKGGITLGYATSGKNYAVQLDANGKAYVNVPWNNTTYSVFSSSANGLVPKPTEAVKAGSFLRVDGTWVVPTDTKYTLPVATTSVLGGIKSSTIDIVSNRMYPVSVDSTGVAQVCVPWTDTNTTYTAISDSEIDTLFA